MLKEILEEFRDISLKGKIEIFALFFAGLFFVFQVSDGSFFSNVKVNLSTERVHKVENTDFLVLKIDLEKGIIGSIILKNILIKNDCSGSEPVFTNINTNKYKYSSAHSVTSQKTNEAIALSSGDKVSFSEYFEVDINAVCSIEAVIGGNRFLWGDPQWISSIISLPKRK